MISLAKVLVTLFLSALCCSCNLNFNINGLKGEGEVVRKEKSINENFTAIKASRGLDVILLESNDKKVIVEANKNLHDHIEVYVKENTLYVTSDENIYRADEKNVIVSYQNLDKIHVNSGASISSQNVVSQKELDLSATSGADIKLDLNAKNVSTSVTSGAMVDLSGKVNNHSAKATSGADIRAKDLLSMVSEAKATSGASIKIYAKKEFTGKATSGADVIYYGNPQKVTASDNSGGDVRKN